MSHRSFLNTSALTLNPGHYLGLLGGGQLGRMFCQAAQRLGFKVVVLDPAADSPAAQIADQHIQSTYDDICGLDRLAKLCQVITTEFENIPAASLNRLAINCRVYPSAQAVAKVQNRIVEKAFIASQNLAVGPYAVVQRAADLATVPESLFPGILKIARFGYDGKGQIRIKTREQGLQAFKQWGEVPCVLEAQLCLKAELSVILARNVQGQTAVFPVAKNLHREGILTVTSVAAPHVSSANAIDIDHLSQINSSIIQQQVLDEQAIEAALILAKGLDYVGVMAVEFFVLNDGHLLVNEIAPRPHNSGHYTIDACVTSQFEQQVRAITNLPLGSTALLTSAVMLNILGDVWFAQDAEQSVEPNWATVLLQPAVKLHLYGKNPARRGRKMGHLTCLAPTLLQAQSLANQAAKQLHITAPFSLAELSDFIAEETIVAAAQRLKSGELVAFPTETVYGLGADAENESAVSKIYTTKGRPSQHPVIVHIACCADISYWATHIPDIAYQLIQAFWPGPLTLILQRALSIPSMVSGGQNTIGLRCPAHPVAQRLLLALAAIQPNKIAGIAAPSANRFGQVSPTRSAHVQAEFQKEVSQGLLVLPGGEAEIGIESTILDLSRIDQGVGPVLLRPGHISSEQIAQVIGIQPLSADADAPRAPGRLTAHYATRTPLELALPKRWNDILSGINLPDGLIAVVAYSPCIAKEMPWLKWYNLSHEPVAYAQSLYAMLRQLDEQNFATIVIQAPPPWSEWQAVNDRLHRAAAAFLRG